MLNEIVVVRTYSAGVHIGRLVRHEGREVELADAVRLWRWRGANTLHEVARKGVDQDYTRISESIMRVILTEAIEIIPASGRAIETFTPRWPA